MYLYYMTQRPPMPGAMPKDGLVTITEFPVRKFVSSIDAEAYAELSYNRKLTNKEVSNYELIPMYSMVPLTRHEINQMINLLTDEVMRDASRSDELYDTYTKMKRILEGK